MSGSISTAWDRLLQVERGNMIWWMKDRVGPDTEAYKLLWKKLKDFQRTLKDNGAAKLTLKDHATQNLTEDEKAFAGAMIDLDMQTFEDRAEVFGNSFEEKLLEEEDFETEEEEEEEDDRDGDEYASAGDDEENLDPALPPGPIVHEPDDKGPPPKRARMIDELEGTLLQRVMEAIEDQVVNQKVDAPTQTGDEDGHPRAHIFGRTEHGHRAGVEYANRIALDAMHQRLQRPGRDTDPTSKPMRRPTQKVGKLPLTAEVMGEVMASSTGAGGAPNFLSDVNTILHTPLTGSQLLRICTLLGMANIFAVSDDREINPVYGGTGHGWVYCLALVFPDASNTGHWICFKRNPGGASSVLFTSYGLDWQRNKYYDVRFNAASRSILGKISEPHKGMLYETLGFDTCGLWCILWAFCVEHGMLSPSALLSKAMAGVRHVKYDARSDIPEDRRTTERTKANDMYVARAFYKLKQLSA